MKSKEEIEFEQWSNETFCMEAVKNDCDSLRYVKEQTTFQKIIKNRSK